MIGWLTMLAVAVLGVRHDARAQSELVLQLAAQQAEMAAEIERLRRRVEQLEAHRA